MIIRSGLIENKPGVDPDDFARHWREVHGPLAQAIPNLRGYAQNLVVRRGPDDGRLHRVDGLSQLWFDDVPAMERGTNSPEQLACIVDIGQFLDHVTLAIQQPGTWREIAPRSRGEHKLMAIYAGPASTEDIARQIEKATAIAGVVRWRFNPVTTQGVMVDASVAHSAVAVVGVCEAWFALERDRDAAVDTPWPYGKDGLAPSVVLGVSEATLMRPR